MHVVGLVTVAVLVYAPSGGHAADRLGEARQAIERALRAIGAEVIDEPVAAARRAHAAGATDERALAFFGQGRAQVEEGRRALERVELAQARARFAEAARELVPELWRPGVATLLSDVFLLDGIAAYDAQDRAQAEVDFRRAVALEPTAELTEAQVRPELVRAFRAATAPRPPSARLRLQTDATDVTVDGKAVTPSQALAVSPGPHLVRAARAQRLPKAALVDVADQTTIELPLLPDIIGDQLAALDREPGRAAVQALVSTLGLDEVMVAAAGIDGGAPVIAAARVDGGGCTTAPIVRALDGVASLVGRLRDAPCGGHQAGEVLTVPAIAHPRPAEPPAAPVAERPKPRVIESPWLWSGVIAAAGLAIGLGVGLAPHTTAYTINADGGSFAK